MGEPAADKLSVTISEAVDAGTVVEDSASAQDGAVVEDIAEAGLALYARIFEEAMARIAFLAEGWQEPSAESDAVDVDADQSMSTSATTLVPVHTEMAVA